MIDIRSDLASPDTRDVGSDIDPDGAEGVSCAAWYRDSCPVPEPARAGPGGLRVGAGRKAHQPLVEAARPWLVQGISRAAWYRRSRRRRGVPAEPIADEFHWYCVRTSHGGERLASSEIGQAGFDVFAPTVWRPGEPARRYTNGSIRPARPARVVSLFRRYIFVRFNRADLSWARISRHEMESVAYIVGATPGMPIIMPEQAIALIRSLCEPNDCVYPDGTDLGRVRPTRSLSDVHAAVPIAPLESGSTLQLVGGAMVDRKVICDWSDGKRVKFMMQFLGRQVPVTAAQSSVAAI